MSTSRTRKIGVALLLVGCLTAAIVVVVLHRSGVGATTVTAYFDNSNGIYEGDEVVILGTPVGKVEKIEPQPQSAKITFRVDDQYKVPAEANAVIINPTLVSARAIQLTPAYTSGPVMRNGAIIPRERTAVPVEFDDLRKQLEKLTQTLQPTAPGGVSTMGEFVNTAADNLRGQGASIRQTLIQLSQAVSALGDHSSDIFGTLNNLSVLVSALRKSAELMRQLNVNFASVTSLLADDSNEIGDAVKYLDAALGDVASFVADNREPLGTASDKLSTISAALVDSLDDIKQTLHVAPNAFQNFINIYEPANASFTGVVAMNNFSNPLQFICSAVQAASRLNNEQSAKLCVQYLAPIFKNRQLNFPPIAANPFVGAQARPNEVTFSEDWLRPLTEAGRVRDFFEGPLPANQPPPPTRTTPTDPGAGLPGIMVPSGAGS